ncbi:hypothetical protein F2Q69_00059615 [Brassica cretica]|uniref:Uncharacterized protein n=1 Tax=Brassica cretica TaxID=69181 RepID=A0A8S9RI35_BRACR|nr:hypothetical protein F2Q69_00059615 [Brassica cretica]
MARELGIRDHKDKVKDLEKVAEASADVLATSRKSQELEEGIDILKTAAETFKLEMVMAVKGARVIARWESMREWLKKQNDQWDLAKALEQYKAVIREEAMNKSVPPPTFEDKPVIPPVSDMDLFAKLSLCTGIPFCEGVFHCVVHPSVVLEPGGQLVTQRSCKDPKVVWEPEGSSIDHEIVLGPGDLEIVFGTRRLYGNPKRPYSAFLGKTTTGTCSDLAFCPSEAGPYRVSMLHVASAGSHYQTLGRPYSAFLGKTTTGTCSDLAFCPSEAGPYRVSMLHVASAGSHYQTLGAPAPRTSIILKPVGSCSPHLDYLIGSFPPGRKPLSDFGGAGVDLPGVVPKRQTLLLSTSG